MHMPAGFSKYYCIIATNLHNFLETKSAHKNVHYKFIPTPNITTNNIKKTIIHIIIYTSTYILGK